MKVEVVHEFPCPPDRFFDILESDELERAIVEHSTSKRELIEDRHEGDVRVRRWRITPSRELPGVIQKLIGAKSLAYEQVSRVDRANRRVDWRIEVAQAAGRADIGGVLHVVETPTGCRRTMIGHVEIRVPIVGGRVEKVLAEDVRKTYERSHRLISRLLDA
ncbi:MAG: DUF2505 domain-containing protein [Alphaproteobacteria bacterium]|nr:DUF2505 domain-containing protein [Alphaproteobacteria bacterium]